MIVTVLNVAGCRRCGAAACEWTGLARQQDPGRMVGKRLEEPLNELVEVVRQHYEADSRPLLLLSRFGQLHGDLLARLKLEHGGLAAAVRAAGFDRLRIVKLAAGQEIVVTAERAAEVDHRAREEAAARRTSSTQFDSLPGAVKLAFVVRTEENEQVALKVSPPYFYEKLPTGTPIRSDYRLVDERYRRPRLLLKAASAQDREALWGNFLLWSETHALDPASFIRGTGSNALQRLLGAQESDILKRLNIPADIVALLLKHP